MSRTFVAEFDGAAALVAGAAAMRDGGYRLIDAFTPFPVKGLDGVLHTRPSRIRTAMLVAWLGMAAAAFALQWYSAVIDYPINSGGRPLNSWPVFLLVPFEVGVFAAAAAGFIALLWGCGLPRLHHPVFDVIGFERSTQDRFFLLASDPRDEEPAVLREAFRAAGALDVAELHP